MSAESSGDDLSLRHVWSRLSKLQQEDDQGTVIKLEDRNAKEVSLHCIDKECTQVRFITLMHQPKKNKRYDVVSDTATARLLKKDWFAKELYVKKFEIPKKHSIVAV